MKKSASISLLALVPLRALLLAGLLCAPCLASAATSIDVTSVTNRYFNDYDDFEAFRQLQLIQVEDSLDSIRSEKHDISRVRDRLVSITNDLHLISDQGYEGYSLWYQNGQAIDGDHASDYITGQNLIWNSLNRANTTLARAEYALSYLDRVESSSTAASNDLVAVRSALTSPALPTYQIVVNQGSTSTNFYYTSVTNIYVEGGGGCSCPDYSGVLNNIRALILEISGNVSEIVVYLDEIGNAFLGLIESWAHYSGAGYSSDLWELGFYAGKILGGVVSNNWDYVYYANLYSDIGNGIFDVNGVRIGPRFLQEMWNYILSPIAQTWADYEWNPDNRMIHGFRDFYIGDHIVAVTNEPLNPIWVEFTNSVSLSDETLDALTNTFFSLDQLMQSLTNAVFTVTWDEETMEKQQEVEKEQTQLAADEAESQNSDPDADNVDLPTTDISGVSGIATHVSSVVSSYKAMFTTIPHDLPDDILIHEGWVMRMPSLGNTRAVGDDFEVESIHWRPGDDSTLSRLLSGMRGLFVGLWLLVFIAVIWGAMSIDLFIAGVCIYCTYGLLLGKPETTLRGIRFMFRLLCSLLGRDPPK